jgi:hypothetical protein
MTKRDDELMDAALVEARKSLDLDEFPLALLLSSLTKLWCARTGKGRPSVGSWITRKCSHC